MTPGCEMYSDSFELTSEQQISQEGPRMENRAMRVVDLLTGEPGTGLSVRKLDELVGALREVGNALNPMTIEDMVGTHDENNTLKLVKIGSGIASVTLLLGLMIFSVVLCWVWKKRCLRCKKFYREGRSSTYQNYRVEVERRSPRDQSEIYELEPLNSDPRPAPRSPAEPIVRFRVDNELVSSPTPPVSP